MFVVVPILTRDRHKLELRLLSEAVHGCGPYCRVVVGEQPDYDEFCALLFGSLIQRSSFLGLSVLFVSVVSRQNRDVRCESPYVEI